MIFREIWSEHSLIERVSAIMGFDSGSWQIFKKITNRNKRKCWHPFGDQGFVIPPHEPPLQAAMGDKTVKTLRSKIWFSSVLDTFSPLPPKTMLIFPCIPSTAHTIAPTQHWIGGAGDSRELTLNANKIQQMSKYRKTSFPRSVSTTFVAHCLEAI